MSAKIVLVTRKTRLQGLVEKYNTASQARFYLEHAGCDFSDYEREDENYNRALERVEGDLVKLDAEARLQVLPREMVPSYVFDERDVIVALGQDGLVANTAKYAAGRPLIGVNPDPERFDGVLLPFTPERTLAAVRRVRDQQAHVRKVTLAEARLADGQRLLAFNDLFIGARSHVSARYRIRLGSMATVHSSSGIIVSTGAGSTGWLSSVFQMAASISRLAGGAPPSPVRLAWEEESLVYIVREPFLSRHSTVELCAGVIGRNTEIVVESLMPSEGVIFSDGMEADFLRFDSGTVATIGVAPEKACLVVG